MTINGLSMNKGTAAVYGRRSNWDEGVSFSVTTQGANGRRHGELLGYTVGDDDIYLDDGISGMTEDRPAFRAMMMKALSPEKPYKAIIVTDISRLSRETGTYIDYEEILADEGIELVSLMEPPGNPQLKINTHRRMKAVMNESQVADAALKTRNSQMFAVEMGFYIGWTRPFGYLKRKVMWRGAEHTKLEQHPDEWPHFLHAKEMGKENYSLREIIAYLENTGLKHPGAETNLKKNGKVGTRGNGKWTTDNTSYLLTKSKAVLGQTARGGKGSGSKIPNKSDEVICLDAHPAAMTEEEREQIKRNLASRRKQAKSPEGQENSNQQKSPRSHGSPNPLGGILVCEMCGSNIQLHTSNGIPRLVCANKRDYRKDHPNWCPNPAVRLDVFIIKTLRAILGHILTNPVLRRMIRMVVKENRDFVTLQMSRKKEIEKRLTELEREIENLVNAVAAGDASLSLKGGIKLREKDKELLERENATISTELEDKLVFLNDADRIIENAMKIRTYLETENQHNVTQMMQSLIRKASILNGTVTLQYTLPLPKNGTEESILTERLNLDKKSCLSVGHAGMTRGKPFQFTGRVGRPSTANCHQMLTRAGSCGPAILCREDAPVACREVVMLGRAFWISLHLLVFLLAVVVFYLGLSLGLSWNPMVATLLWLAAALIAGGNVWWMVRKVGD